MKVGIVNVGIGNLASVQRMIESVGGSAFHVTAEADLQHADRLILPGVGHFDHGMRSLANAGLVGPLREMARHRRVPLLGICLGMQLLCRSSEEGIEQGLGIIDAEVQRFTSSDQNKIRIPHMGWNVAEVTRSNDLIRADQGEQRFYFVHSYVVVPRNPVIQIACSEYGGRFCAAFEERGIYGVQFHPEKSHRFGKSLFRNFLNLGRNVEK